MCKRSDEGNLKGLGLIDAEVKKFITNSDYKVPHMGWNIVIPEKNNRLIPISNTEYRYYFVHSYRVVPNNQKRIVSGVTSHGKKFCSAFEMGNIFGVQFHLKKAINMN